jgi:hypothetical protein
MQYLEYPLWLAEQAFSALYYFWPITLALVIPFLITLALKSPFTHPKTNFYLRHISVLIPLAVTLLILVWGTVMKYPGDSRNLAPIWPSCVVLALLIVQLFASIGVVWLMKGYRLFSVFTVVLELYFALACAFMAYMSVSGDWL